MLVANTPVTLYSHYTELARRCEISQSAVGSPKNAENRCILFSIFYTMEMSRRPCGDCGVSRDIPRSVIAFLRSSSWRSTARSRRAHGALTARSRRAHGVSTACTPRVRSGHRARTARARPAHGPRTASTQRWRHPIIFSLKQRADI